MEDTIDNEKDILESECQAEDAQEDWDEKLKSLLV